MVVTVSSKTPPRTEPDWSRFLEAVDAGVIRLASQQRQYVEARVNGATHFIAVEGLNLKGFAGWKLRGRLIDGWEQLTKIRAEQQPAVTA